MNKKEEIKSLMDNAKASLNTALMHIADPSIRPRLTPSIIKAIEDAKVLTTLIELSGILKHEDTSVATEVPIKAKKK